MELFVSTKIKIATSPIHGFGVFATESIDRDELIEECAFLELPIKPKESTSLLIDYRFNYPSGPYLAQVLFTIIAIQIMRTG
jgi:hypothetical protein